MAGFSELQDIHHPFLLLDNVNLNNRLAVLINNHTNSSLRQDSSQKASVQIQRDVFEWVGVLQSCTGFDGIKNNFMFD